MLRWLGAGLILGAGLLARRTVLETARAEQQTRLELSSAFETMEGEIRLLLTPLPTLLRRGYGAKADAFFTRVTDALRSTDLPLAWRSAAAELLLSPEEQAAVAELGVRLCGGEESVCAALTLAAAQLRKRYEETEQKRPENERLSTSMLISVSLFLILLLL